MLIFESITGTRNKGFVQVDILAGYTVVSTTLTELKDD